MSRKGLAKETDGIIAARKQNTTSLTKDPRWKALKNSDRRHMRLLLRWHDPLTGYLRYRTRALNLVEELEMSEEMLRRSRHRLIAAGLIVSYVPGSGRIASTYCVARSWSEAEEAAALRRAPDAPHFPELVDRTPSAVDGRPAAAAEEDQEQEQEEAPAELADARERYAQARRRKRVRGPVPPELPTPVPPSVPDVPALREAAEHRATTDLSKQIEITERGSSAARANLRPGPAPRPWVHANGAA